VVLLVSLPVLSQRGSCLVVEIGDLHSQKEMVHATTAALDQSLGQATHGLAQGEE
jgi:hypothetical protein